MFIDKKIEVHADIRDAYDVWTVFESYPSFMDTVERVTWTDDGQQHWVATVDAETSEWDAELVEHVADEKVAWRALDGRESGEVRFEKLAGDRTMVTYQLEYDPAAWQARAGDVQRWMDHRVEHDLDAFKELVETGM